MGARASDTDFLLPPGFTPDLLDPGSCAHARSFPASNPAHFAFIAIVWSSGAKDGTGRHRLPTLNLLANRLLHSYGVGEAQAAAAAEQGEGVRAHTAAERREGNERKKK